MTSILEFLARLAVWLLLAPLLPGIINKVKAWVAGRRGPPVLQQYYDLARLWRKGVVLSTLASPGFIAGPAIAWVAVLAAALLLPLGPLGTSLSFRGDVILLVYLLALARFCTAWAALETGSAFEGMGAAREVSFAVRPYCFLFWSPASFYGRRLRRLPMPGSLKFSSTGGSPAVTLQVNIGFLVDAISLVMMLTVSGVSFVIHVYSIGYMHDDPGFRRYFTYLNLFVFFMLILVSANSFLLMFIGWEGVGLCSYLLIGFWYQNKAPADAGKKAFIVNRIGDYGFLLAMMLIFVVFGSLDFLPVFEKAPQFYTRG